MMGELLSKEVKEICRVSLMGFQPDANLKLLEQCRLS